MMDHPSLRELVDAVQRFIEQVAMPELNGHAAFQARIAANALAIVSRQLEAGPAAETAEKNRLIQLTGQHGSLEALNRQLCHMIRADSIDLTTPGLAAHLEATVRDKIAIDQPNYAKN